VGYPTRTANLEAPRGGFSFQGHALRDVQRGTRVLLPRGPGGAPVEDAQPTVLRSSQVTSSREPLSCLR